MLAIAGVNNGFARSLSQQLAEDISDGELDRFSLIEAAFIISGADNPSELERGMSWFRELLNDIESKNLIGFEKVASAERLFLYFHTTWLKDYQEKSTTLLDIMDRRQFNCVSATVLYNLTCDELGLKTHAFETPTHVYTIFSNITETVMVENTTSMGFNIMKNLKSYSQYLKRYYPEQLALKIGLDRLYYHENSQGREINNTELLGLICYNLSIFHFEKQRYESAYQYVELAQRFNQDSRSNRKFEMRLYYVWGKQLFETRDYFGAFTVTADAYYRYPDNSDFKQNCRLAFKKALHGLWQNKDWQKSMQLMLEMDALAIRSDEESAFQQQLLHNWIALFKADNQRSSAREAMQLLKNFSDH